MLVIWRLLRVSTVDPNMDDTSALHTPYHPQEKAERHCRAMHPRLVIMSTAKTNTEKGM